MGSTKTTCPIHVFDFSDSLWRKVWTWTPAIFFDFHSAARAFIHLVLIFLNFAVGSVRSPCCDDTELMTILIYLQAGMTGLKLVIPEQSAEQLPNFTELGKPAGLGEEYGKKF
jgi:hypothetical protein